MKRLLLLLCLCLPFAASAEGDEDKGRLTRFLEDALSGAGRTVTIDGFTGALDSVASMEKLTIADAKGVWLRLDNISLDWNRAALFKGRLEVNSLAAKTITLSRKPESSPSSPSPEATPFALPDLPVSVQISQVRADKITLGENVFGHAVTAKLSGALSLVEGAGQADFALNRTDDIAGAFLLKTKFDSTTRQLSIDLSATEAAGGLIATLLNIPDQPSIALMISGDAPLSNFRADLSLATDGIERVTGRLQSTTSPEIETVSAKNGLSLDINGDLSPLVVPRFRPFFGQNSALTAKLRKAEDGRLGLDQLNLTTAAMRISGRALLTQSYLPESFALDITLGRGDAEALLLPTSSDLSLSSGKLEARYDAAQSDVWTLSGEITGFTHPSVTAQRIDLTGSGRMRPKDPSHLSGDIRVLASGLRATDNTRPETARALGPQAKIDLGMSWTDGEPLEISRLNIETQSGQIDAVAQIKGPLLNPEITTQTSARLSNLAILAPVVGRPLSGTLEANLEGALTPLSGAFDLKLSAETDRLRIGQPEIDLLTRDGRSRLSLSLKRDEQGLVWQDANITSQALKASSNGALRSGGGTIILDAELDTLARFLPSVPGPGKLSLRAEGADHLWRLTASANGPGNAQLVSEGTLHADFSNANLTAEGILPLEIVNAATDSLRLSGQAGINLRLNGPLALSSLGGTVNISGARLSVAEPQIALDDIGATVTIANSVATLASNGAFALGGTYALNGTASISEPFDADLTARFNDVQLRYQRFLETTVVGEARISGPLLGGALISGDIRLDSTEIRVNSLSSTGASLPEITHINAPTPVTRTRGYAGVLGNAQERTKRSAYLLDLGISAPNRIFLRGLGLDAEFGGALRLRGDTNNILTSGQLDLLRGRMDFLAERFVLSEGEIRMQGDPIPYFRLVATTQSTDASFDLTMEGRVDEPVLSVSSSPAMPQDEALAQMLFGETLSDISPIQAARLAAAVATLSGRSSFNPLGSLRESVGVDDLDLKTDAEGNTSITAGKYISDNIYTEVEVDASGKSTLSLNLDVTPSLTLKGSAGSEAENGLGLFFQKDY